MYRFARTPTEKPKMEDPTRTRKFAPLLSLLPFFYSSPLATTSVRVRTSQRNFLSLFFYTSISPSLLSPLSPSRSVCVLTKPKSHGLKGSGSIESEQKHRDGKRGEGREVAQKICGLRNGQLEREEREKGRCEDLECGAVFTCGEADRSTGDKLVILLSA